MRRRLDLSKHTTSNCVKFIIAIDGPNNSSKKLTRGVNKKGYCELREAIHFNRTQCFFGVFSVFFSSGFFVFLPSFTVY